MNQHFIAIALASVWLLSAIALVVFMVSKNTAKVKRQLFPYLILAVCSLYIAWLYVASRDVKTLDFNFVVAAVIFVLAYLAAFKLTIFCDFCGASLANLGDGWHQTLYCSQCGQKLSANIGFQNSNLTAKKLLRIGYFFCVSFACVALPSVLQQTCCFYDRQPSLFLGIGLLFLGVFYGVLGLASFVDLSWFAQRVPNIGIFQLAPANKIISFGAMIISLPVVLTMGFLLSMLTLWNGYNNSKEYWNYYQAVIHTEAKLFGIPMAQMWCYPPAERAWYQGDCLAAKKYCELAASLQNKNPVHMGYNSSQLLRLGDFYWKAGHYENALTCFSQAHVLLGPEANNRHYANEPSVVDLRQVTTMQPVIVEFYDFRDCLDNCMDKLGAAKTYSQFSQFAPWLRYSNCGSIHHGKHFMENGVVILDKGTYERLCQASRYKLTELALSDSVLDKIYQVPASWITKLQKES